MVTVQRVAEQRMVLHHIGWDTYEALMRDYADRSAPRFTYDRGELEIVSPLAIHERYTRCIEMFIAAVVDRIGADTEELGSTTFKREDLQRGFEPDACVYLRNAPLVLGKDQFDLRVDPPPDLVVEVDITHSSIYKLPIFASFGVPEVWRYDGEQVEMLLLTGENYARIDQSQVLPGVSAAALTDLLRDSAGLTSRAWRRRVRAWAEHLPAGPDSNSAVPG